MAPLVARIVAIYTMRSVATQHVGLISGYPTCPRVSVVQVQWTRGQEECSGGGCRAGVQSADFQSVVLTSTLAQAATIYRGHEGNQPDIT